MNAFGPKKILIFMHAFWQLLKILKNCQNGTFLPMNENQKIFGPNVFI